MTIFKELKKADYVTLLGITFVILAFWFLLRGNSTKAVAMILIGIFFDFIDGKVARKYGSSEYGKILDSLFDVSGFVLFPVLLLMVNGRTNLISLIVIVLFCLSGYLRLARFTVKGVTNKTNKYIGMPVLLSTFAIIIYQFNNGLFSLIWLLIMTPLMISDFRFHKPKHPIYGIILLILAVRFFYA